MLRQLEPEIATAALICFLSGVGLIAFVLIELK